MTDLFAVELYDENPTRANGILGPLARTIAHIAYALNILTQQNENIDTDQITPDRIKSMVRSETAEALRHQQDTNAEQLERLKPFISEELWTQFMTLRNQLSDMYGALERELTNGQIIERFTNINHNAAYLMARFEKETTGNEVASAGNTL